MIDLLLHFLLLGAVVFILAETLPGMHCEGYGTALLVAVVYGVINVTLGTVLKLLALPLIFITLSLFLLVINAFLLWITDQILDDFEIENGGTLAAAAVVITLSDTVLSWIF